MLPAEHCPLVRTTVRLLHHRITVLIPASYTKHASLCYLRMTPASSLRVGHLSGDPRLTKEQDVIRLRGLRILARMIVRAHLASLIEDDAGGRNAPSTGDGESPRKEDERVR